MRMPWQKPVEVREAPPLPNGIITQQNFFEVFGWMGSNSIEGVSVTTETALGVPAIWAAVNFLSGTLAGLPLNVYRRSGDGRSKVNGGMQTILHDAVNDETSSFEWRKRLFEQVLTGGRSFTFIERSPSGVVLNLWLLDANKVSVKRENGRKTYEYKMGGRTLVYAASEIIDIPFMLRPDGLGHYGPIKTNERSVALAIAAERYGAKFFENGGVPPFAVTGNFQSANALKRAGDELAQAVKKATKESRQALVLPIGLEIKPIGIDAEKAQLVETQRFSIEQAARIYQMPPTFLQDLTHGTMANTEQQDLHFVKHTVKRWVEQFEQELNLKLWGRSNNRTFAELNVDGLLRGDFGSRMEGYSKSIQNAIMTPNEARRKENLPDNPQGNSLLVQGATVPLGTQPNNSTPTPDAAQA
jgi:HK97 family phage portal protein